MQIKSKNIVRPAIGTVAILLIPLVAMQFTKEVDWGVGDFLIIGTLLFGAGFAYELILNKVQDKKQRLLIGLLILLAVLYIWAELAVGIFTNLGS